MKMSMYVYKHVTRFCACRLSGVVNLKILDVNLNFGWKQLTGSRNKYMTFQIAYYYLGHYIKTQEFSYFLRNFFTILSKSTRSSF